MGDHVTHIYGYPLRITAQVEGSYVDLTPATVMDPNTGTIILNPDRVADLIDRHRMQGGIDASIEIAEALRDLPPGGRLTVVKPSAIGWRLLT